MTNKAEGQERPQWQTTLFMVQNGTPLYRVARDALTVKHPGKYTRPAWIIRTIGDAESLANELNALEDERDRLRQQVEALKAAVALLDPTPQEANVP